MDVALSFSIVGASTRYAFTNLLLLFCLHVLVVRVPVMVTVLIFTCWLDG